MSSDDQGSASTIPQSQERLLDAQAIEAAAATLDRPTAKMHLEGLAKKLRKEAEALKRIEASKEKAAAAAEQPASDAPAAETTKAAAPMKAVTVSSVKYTPIDRFAFDAGGYNSKFVTLYVDLPGVGSIPKDNIKCDFGKDSFDLIVNDLKGKSYRLLKSSLEKDIQPDKSNIKIKPDKILIKLAKCESTGEYTKGYENWTKLTDPNKKQQAAGASADSGSNPSAGIMNMMKDMYESGDDKTRKMIGETMMKQRQGGGSGAMGGGMGGMGGGMGGMGDMMSGMMGGMGGMGGMMNGLGDIGKELKNMGLDNLGDGDGEDYDFGSSSDDDISDDDDDDDDSDSDAGEVKDGA